MTSPADLAHLDTEQLRALSAKLMADLAQRDALIVNKDSEINFKQAVIDKLTQEIAVYKRLQFGKKSEQFQGEQGKLLLETIDTDMAVIEVELAALRNAVPAADDAKRDIARRAKLPADLPRVEIRHEPASTDCQCGCAMQHIGDDVSEKLDYTPGVFSVERHIRPKWACRSCETIRMAPMPADVIDKGIPTAGLLAHVMVSKFIDHNPLYRQQGTMARAGVVIPQSTLGEWVGIGGMRLIPLVEALKAEVLSKLILHADETPVSMLDPGAGKAKKAYLWAYAPTQFDDLRAVIYDFTPSRAGANCQQFLGEWEGGLVTDDYAGYKALFRDGVTELGCMAHARRKFFDLHDSNKSSIAGDALEFMRALYDVEREAADLPAQQRQQLRQERSRPIAQALHQWLLHQRQRVPQGSGTAKALDYSLHRWEALTRYLDDGSIPIDNNWVENQIRPWALGRKNWLFAGSLRAGQRAAAIMSLLVSAKLNGHDPYAYLKDVLTRLPTQKNHLISELLPHRWRPTTSK